MQWPEAACGLGLGDVFYHCETKSIIYVLSHTSLASVNCASKLFQMTSNIRSPLYSQSGIEKIQRDDCVSEKEPRKITYE